MKFFWLIYLLPLSVLAADWPAAPYTIPYTPTDDYNFRPPPTDNARSIAPLDYPAELYDYGSFNNRRVPPPQFVVEISNNRPYVHENVILTLRVISANSVKRMDPVLPQLQEVTFQILHDPIASNQFENGQAQIVNEIRYMVTPVIAGSINLQFSINTTVADYGQQDLNFTLQAPQAIKLEIQPQVTGINPWLPLENLAITSNIDTPPEVEPGESIALVLRVVAAGALGNQLPSLERLLKSPDFRVYRGKTQLEGGPSKDFRHIMGTRTEHYTLVPQYSGSLRLPPLRVLWFNVRTGIAERSSLLINKLESENSDTTSEQLFSPSFFNIGLSIFGLLIMLMLGYWIGINYDILHTLSVPKMPLTSTATKLWRISKRLNLKPYLHRILNKMANMLPLSIRFWWWVCAANVERVPTLWRKTLQFLSWRTLARSPYITCPEMARIIVNFNAGIEPERLKNLLKTLDSATYGNQSIDFEIWKRDFERQIRPNLFSFLYDVTKRNQHKSHLLPLNPDEV